MNEDELDLLFHAMASQPRRAILEVVRNQPGCNLNFVTGHFSFSRIGVYDQFGQGYARIRDFRRRFLETLRQVQAVYPQSRLTADEGGITLEHSPPPVAGKSDRLMLG